MCIISILTETSSAGIGQAGDNRTYQINALSIILALFNETLSSRGKDNMKYVIQEGILRLITDSDSDSEDILEVDSIVSFEVTARGLRITCRNPFRIFTLTYNQVCCI